MLNDDTLVMKYIIKGRKHVEKYNWDNTSIQTIDIIKNRLPQTPYPRTMFENVQPDKLNDFVLRFVMEKDTKEDRKALEGLVTSMS